LLFAGAAFLVADDDHAAPMVLADSGNQGAVFGKSTIAVELHEILEQALDVIVGVGAIRMPRELHLLHRRKLGEDLACQLGGLVLEPLELGTKTVVFMRELAQLAHARDELHDGTLEGQDVSHSGGTLPRDGYAVETFRISSRLRAAMRHGLESYRSGWYVSSQNEPE
jgi:hypothetical protein